MALLFNSIPMPQIPTAQSSFFVGVFWINDAKTAYVSFLEDTPSPTSNSNGYIFTVDFHGSPAVTNTQVGSHGHQLAIVSNYPNMGRQDNQSDGAAIDDSGGIWSVNFSDMIVGSIASYGSGRTLVPIHTPFMAPFPAPQGAEENTRSISINSFKAGGVNYVAELGIRFSENQSIYSFTSEWVLGIATGSGRSSTGDSSVLFNDENPIGAGDAGAAGFVGVSDPIYDNVRFMYIAQHPRGSSTGWTLYKFDLLGGHATLVTQHTYATSGAYGGLYDSDSDRLIMFNFAGGFEVLACSDLTSQFVSATGVFAQPFESLAIADPSKKYAITPEYCLAAQRWTADTTNKFFFGLDSNVTFVGSTGYAGLKRIDLTTLTLVDIHYPPQEWLTGSTSPVGTFTWEFNSFINVPILNALLWSPTKASGGVFYELFWPVFTPGGGGVVVNNEAKVSQMVGEIILGGAGSGGGANTSPIHVSQVVAEVVMSGNSIAGCSPS